MKCVVLWSFLIIASGCAVAHESFYFESKLPLTRNSSISKRITGGDPAAPGQFPYQAGLKIKMGTKTAFCGGTLMSNQAVLTAAHCCEKADEVEVILGSVSIKDDTEPSRVSMVVPRRNIRVHKKWNSLKIVNDICILKLPQRVEFNDNIQPASLPLDDLQDYAKSSVVSSGWGKDDDKATSVSPILRFVESKIVSNSICSVFYFGRVKDSHICFDGAGGKSTCNGDSGGPLVLTADGRTVIGITSFGIAFGCEKGWPPVFTRVSKFLPWIKDNLK